MGKKIESSYSIETEEYNQDNVQFIVINRKPAEADAQCVKEELYKIFRKYA
jgi:hypothetical protein